jgi:uncharacterized membrane protein HdeD (DUF308 family)
VNSGANVAQRREATAVKSASFIGIGAMIALVGVVWTLQGLGYIGDSVMSGVTLWAVVGPIVAVSGIAVAAAGFRARRSPPPKQ